MQNTLSPDLSIFFDDPIDEFSDLIGLDDTAFQLALRFYAEDLLMFD